MFTPECFAQQMLDHPFAYAPETAYGAVMMVLNLVHLSMLCFFTCRDAIRPGSHWAQ